ncbi:MAG: sensor histidine kinase [Leifsonia xyli]|nr:MAG: sensor histidine kinase [Leifsonia xyli]
MIRSRWWLLGLASVGVITVAALVATGAPAAELAAGVVAVVGYSALFVLLRRGRMEEGSPGAIVLTVGTVLFAGTVTALDPLLAILQCFVYPLVWRLAARRRGAMIASVGIGVAVGIGFAISIPGPDAWQQILLTQLLSVGFAIIMGNWIWGIAKLGDEKSRLLDELRSAQERLAAAERDAGVTSERARMSREVHDTVAQSLTALVLLAQRARREFAVGGLDDESLELIETGARDALAETRALVAATAPVELTQGGIAEALQRLAERFERETRIRVSVTSATSVPLDRDAEVVLLRCAQEGLANVRKHSGAAAARVTLAADAAGARLTVSDDGRGFPAEVHAGFGLAGLRDRLALAGGVLEVDGTPGATAITATLPLGTPPIASAATGGGA